MDKTTSYALGTVTGLKAGNKILNVNYVLDLDSRSVDFEIEELFSEEGTPLEVDEINLLSENPEITDLVQAACVKANWVLQQEAHENLRLMDVFRMMLSSPFGGGPIYVQA